MCVYYLFILTLKRSVFELTEGFKLNYYIEISSFMYFISKKSNSPLIYIFDRN